MTAPGPPTAGVSVVQDGGQIPPDDHYQAERQETADLRGGIERAHEAAGSLEQFAVEVDRSLQGARDEIEKLRALHRLSLRLHCGLDPVRIWQEALDLLKLVVSATGMAAYRVEEGGQVSCCARAGVPLLDLPDDPALGPDVLTWALRADNPASLCSSDGRYLAAPVMTDGRVAGVFALARRGDGFDRQDVELTEMVSLVTAQGIAGAARYRAMEEQALTDGLTGVANYRYFRKQIDLEVARAHRFRYPLGLLIADVDHFKKINDEFGHPAGDSALARTAHAMRLAIRRSDVLARVGGEEFAVILPACDPDQARIVAEKLRLAVRSADGVELDDPSRRIPLTVSVGAAALSGEDLDAQRLIDLADEALLEAKRTGRDRTVVK
jgi:diguanylate cyclase (GGDEF)-like protein